MSDLLSPIYVVFDNNEADAYWGLVGVMRIMVRGPPAQWHCTADPIRSLISFAIRAG